MLPVIIGGLVVVATVTYMGLSWVENKDFPIKKNKPSSSPKENKAHI